MDGSLIGLLSALWLGILTSISPCPLATNIAAISFIGRRVGSPRDVFLSGLLYTVGRVATYTVLGTVIVAGLLSMTELSFLLQKYMNRFLGLILIITGMFLLELIRLRTTGSAVANRLQKRAESWGIWGAGLLGMGFSLSFCPLSAALFFGSLIPLALKSGSYIAVPSFYGVGTGLPVLLFALLIAFGAKSLGSAFDRLTQVEFWARRATGTVFVLIGIYYCLKYIFHVI